MMWKRLTWVRGPVELRDGTLVLLIPLADGGDELAKCAHGIGEIEGDILRITIPDWLAEKLGIREFSFVDVHDDGGKFNISPTADASQLEP